MARGKHSKKRKAIKQESQQPVDQALEQTESQAPEQIDTDPDDTDDSYIGRPARFQYAEKANKVIARKDEKEDEDPFVSWYGNNDLLEPPYSPEDLFAWVEECGTLASCIATYVTNLARPHTLQFTGPDSEKNSTEEQANLHRLESFFGRVNETESFQSLASKLLYDREGDGNLFGQCIRNQERELERMYYIPATYMRITKLDEVPTTVMMKLPRDGQVIEIPGHRRFRRFARVLPDNKIEWFKQRGDPRIVDKTTGVYVQNRDGQFLCEPAEYDNKATEIWWLKNQLGGQSYGIPRWIGAILDVRAIWTAKWINFDMLDQGAIPPFAILYSGELNEGTRKAIDKALGDLQNPQQWNKPLYIGVRPGQGNIDINTGKGKGSAQVEIRMLRDTAGTDYMFAEFLKAAEAAIGATFRIPPILRGITEGYTNATARAAIEVAEREVFEPLRRRFDEAITTEIIQDEFGIYNWEFRTRSSQIGDKETAYRAAGMFGRTAGPSVNAFVDLYNESLGSQHSAFEDPIYNVLPAAVVTALVRQGSLVLGPDNRLIPAPQTEIAAKSEGGVPAEVLKAIEVLTNLVAAGMENDDYEAPDITETDLAQ